MERRNFIKMAGGASFASMLPTAIFARQYHPSFYEMPATIREIFLDHYDIGKSFFRIPLTEAYFEDTGVWPQHYALPNEPRRVEFWRSYHMFKIGDANEKAYGNPALTEKSPEFWDVLSESDIDMVEKRWGYGDLLLQRRPV